MGRRAKTRRDRYGAWLHHLRKERGLTQERLAGVIGVPQSTLAHWERTGNLPGRTVIVRMAQALGVSLTKLLRQKSASD